MLMLADSVESDRLVLLSKAHAAWKVDSVDKASRILQRLRAQTEDFAAATIATTPAAAAQANGSSSSSASALSQRLMHPVPIVSAAAPMDAHAASAAATPHSHTRELANGFRVPLLAPALHTPAVTIAPSVPLPTARQPPLFLVLHNTALLHLRAGKLKLAQIFLARALEHSESLLSSLAPPSAVPAAAASTSSPNSSPSHSRLGRSSAAAADGSAPQMLSPTASRPGSSSGAASRPTPPSPLLSPAASSAGPLGAPLPLYSFLLSKSLELFFTTGVVLLQLHAPAAEGAARICSSSQDWAASEACIGLRLSAQCFRHVLATADSPAWALLPPALASASSTKLLCARIRLADSLSLLHRCGELGKASSALHPLLLSGDEPQEAEPLASILPDDPESLEHAVPHLRRALLILQQQQQKEVKSAAVAVAVAAGPTVASVSLQLAHVLLTLREAQPALDLLSPLLAQRPDPLSPSQLIQAELCAVESCLLLRRAEDALRILAQSRNADVQRVMRACGFSEGAADASIAEAGAESDNAVSLHVCSTLAFILLAQGYSDRAQRCIQLGLDARPSHAPLLQLALLQSMRSGDESVMRSLWMLKRRQSSSVPIGVVAVSTAVESA